jgi:UDP-N-acetylglucosamine--N-acetylmuramyl-(pentapeptide) pyrophosphoryl-undecaprenol N-acetylglucosamine transferase
MSLLPIGKRRKLRRSLGDKTYFSVSSEGYGHSSRALALARHFDPAQILLASYGYALERIRAHEYPSVEISQEVRFVGSEGHFDVGKTILSNPYSALGLNQLIQEEMDVIRRHGVTLVVADGRIAPVLAAERLDIPCIVVTNQSAFYPFFARDSALVKLFGRSFEWVMKLWLSSAEEILIPDFTPPYTVCLPNLSDNFQVKKRTRFVGPLVAWRESEIEPLPRPHAGRPLIVVSLGGHEYRRPLFDAALQAAARLPGLDFMIIAGFEAKRLPENVTVHPFVKEAAPYFKAADLVITQAGHSTAMELLTLGKPSLIVPDSRQIEQENNATRMVALGVSLKMEYDELTDSSQQVLEANIQTLLDSPSYAERSQQFAAMAEQLDGASNAAGHLQEFAHRLSAY